MDFFKKLCKIMSAMYKGVYGWVRGEEGGGSG